MKSALRRRKFLRSFQPQVEFLEQRLALDATAWSSFAGNAQHTSVSSVASQALEAVHWSTQVDNFATSRAAHYGGPLVTLNNTVIYPYKMGDVNTPNFHIVARNGNDGSQIWDIATPYTPPSSSWYPANQPVFAAATNRVYFAGKGGTIYYRDNPDSATGTVTQLAFFGSLAHYTANKTAYDNNVIIETPLTADAQGNIYFGFRVTGATPTNLVSGIAKINANGTITTAAGNWISAFSASGNDSKIGSVQQNGAPAISNDGQTLYIVVKDSGDWVYHGRLLGLNTTTLATTYNSGVLKDPRGADAAILNLSTASPMVAPDGKVFLGVFGNPYNGSRGWMLQFSADLQTKYTPGGFGWDTTPSIVPASMLGANYTGTSSYLIFTKYNNYYFAGGGNDGGDGSNGIAILDPNATEVEYHHPSENTLVMKRVLYQVGPTADWDYPNVPTAKREWCINYGAVDPATNSVIVNSSDGKFYRWNLETNSLIQPLVLTSGIGQPYTMTVIGVDGSIYGIQNGQLFAMGEAPRISISDPIFTEGTGGTTNATFTVSLNYPRTSDVAVSWGTADGSAKAGSDYTAKSGTLIFNPGVKTRTITVAIAPDFFDEPDEQFFVNLSGASNAVILDNQGQATIQDDDAAPNMSIGDVSINEGNTGSNPSTSFTFQVDLSAPSGQTVGIQWATANSTADASDYDAASGTLSFAPGETSKTITILILGDTTYESNESFFINLTGVSNATLIDSQALGTIVNDDGVPSIGINDVPANEGGVTNFTVSLSNASSQSITLNYATSNGTADLNDYIAKSGVVTFAPGVLTRTISISTINDTLDELAETFFVDLSNPANGFLTDSQGQGTINDNDQSPTMAIGNVTLAEGLSGTTAFTFVVSLSTGSGRTVTVNYATKNGTATTANNDYLANSGTISFAAGEVTKTITVLVNGDNVNEPDETFQVNLSNSSGATFTDSQGIGTILNDDSTALSIGDVSHAEGDSGTTSYTFTVNLSSPSSDIVTVNYATTDGSATALDGDYQSVSGTLTFDPDEVTNTIVVLVNGDATNEADETFSVNLSSPVGATMADSQGLGTILNDDPLPVLSLADFSVPEMDYNTGTVNLYVTLSAPSGQTITLNYRTENGTATSTSNIKDYIDTFGTLTFLPGQTVASFPISVVGDIRVESDETVRVILSDPTNAALPDDLAILTILNDDIAMVTLVGASIVEGDNGQSTVDVTVNLSNPSDTTITIDYTTEDGSATAGQDYLGQPGTLTFAPGEMSKTIAITILGDTVDELDEDFEVVLSNAVGAYLPYYPETDVDIDDNDTASIVIADTSVVEGNNGSVAANFVLTLSTVADRPINIDYATANGTALGGSDYNSIAGTLTIPAGASTYTLSVAMFGDTLDEPNETYFVNLSNASDGAILADPQAKGTIVNDDPPSFKVSDISISEGASGQKLATLKILLTRALPATATVDYATSNGTATAGSDYLSISGMLTFAPGVVSQSVTVPILGDTIDELNETFFLNLSNPTGGAGFNNSQAVATIVDDDTASLKITGQNVTEGNSGQVTASFVVKLSTASDRFVSVDYASDSLGTALPNVDFQAVSGTLTFAPGELSKTISVLVNGDLLDESNETYFLNLSNATSGAAIQTSSAKGTIVDNDLARLAISDASIVEGDNGTTNAVFTVTLTMASDHAIGASYATALTGTATSGVDYSAVSETLSFAPGETSKTIIAPVNGDLIDEVDEYFLVNLSAITGGSNAIDSQGKGTIVDNDTSRISITDVSAEEGNSGATPFTFTVSLSNPNSRTVTVRYASANGTALTSNNDYTAASGTVTFLAGELSKNIAISVKGDLSVEPDETFFVNLTSPTNSAITDAQGVGLIVNDDTGSAGAMQIQSVSMARTTPTPSTSVSPTAANHDVVFSSPDQLLEEGSWLNGLANSLDERRINGNSLKTKSSGASPPL